MKSVWPGLLALFLATPGFTGSLQLNRFPTPGLVGYETHLLSHVADPGETFRGFDATFAGPLHQVNPLGLPTIFQDLNPFFPGFGAHPVQDSQFLFNSSDVLFLGDIQSDQLLTAAVSGLAALGLPNPTPFAQIVTNDPVRVDVGIDVDNGTSSDSRFSGSLGSCYADDGVFEPSIVFEKEPQATAEGESVYTAYLEIDASRGAESSAGVYAEFRGDLVQAAGGPTVFAEDLMDPERAGDSHLLVDRMDLAPFEQEGDFELAAVFELGWGAPSVFRVPLAQLVTDNPASISYDVRFSNCYANRHLSGFLIPEPTTASLALGLLLVVGCVTNRNQNR